eukprot:CAMPEP_0185845170 /NCGR_PEP_ID=MMETSP1354-20130828/1204_1 /TAXON_ID=708628 /ORGANISM="Erythrolobus madagascarensis, Strain CCMP3276" /LENGTH=496 /DNA_ID=CAMNT_0028545065 /DNA_START=1379 /DNA_END=2869 /DNA_ORIENTATION=+
MAKKKKGKAAKVTASDIESGDGGALAAPRFEARHVAIDSRFYLALGLILIVVYELRVVHFPSHASGISDAAALSQNSAPASATFSIDGPGRSGAQLKEQLQNQLAAPPAIQAPPVVVPQQEPTQQSEPSNIDANKPPPELPADRAPPVSVDPAPPPPPPPQPVPVSASEQQPPSAGYQSTLTRIDTTVQHHDDEDDETMSVDVRRANAVAREKQEAEREQERAAQQPPAPPTLQQPPGGATPPSAENAQAADGSAQAGAAGDSNSTGSEVGFLQWFQRTGDGEVHESKRNLTCPEETPHRQLCNNLYKIVRKNKLRHIADLNCAHNAHWLETVVAKLAEEFWGFTYTCMSPSEEVIESLKQNPALQPLKNVLGFRHTMWWKPADAAQSDGGAKLPPLKPVDMYFAWDVLAHASYGRIWSFLRTVKAENVRFLLFDHYPAIPNDPSPVRTTINIRRHPFKFDKPLSAISNVTEPGEDNEEVRRQVVLYGVDQIPEKQ